MFKYWLPLLCPGVLIGQRSLNIRTDSEKAASSSLLEIFLAKRPSVHCTHTCTASAVDWTTSLQCSAMYHRSAARERKSSSARPSWSVRSGHIPIWESEAMPSYTRRHRTEFWIKVKEYLLIGSKIFPQSPHFSPIQTESLTQSLTLKSPQETWNGSEEPQQIQGTLKYES